MVDHVAALKEGLTREVREEIEADEGVPVCEHGWRRAICPDCLAVPVRTPEDGQTLLTPEDGATLRTR